MAQIERLAANDLDRAAALYSSVRRRLARADSERLADLIRRRLEAREHDTYLARALADGSIGPTAALELLETYEEAGYVTQEQAGRHRRHALDAHRRELLAYLDDPKTDRSDYYRLLDTYRAAGFLTQEELGELETIIEEKLNPEMAARRLFAEAQVALDPSLQADLLRRYLMEFQGFDDYPHAASLYLSLRIDAQWRKLSQLSSARQATLAIQELNSLLGAYLPHTSDLGEYVPIEQIVEDFRAHARDFDPEPGADELVTAEDESRRVVVISKEPALPKSYEADRNRVVEIGATGRVRAVEGDMVLVEHSGPDFVYARSWGLPTLGRLRLARIPKRSSLALWTQSEVGLLNPRRPSPVFVHQYQAAVHRMAEFLEQHRKDNSSHAPKRGSAVPAGTVPPVVGQGSSQHGISTGDACVPRSNP